MSKELELTAKQLEVLPVKPVTRDEAFAAIKRLPAGRQGAITRIEAQRTVGQFLAQPGIGPVCMESNFLTLNQVEIAVREGIKIAKSKRSTTREKLYGLELVIKAGKACKDITASLLAVAKECGVSTAVAQVVKNEPPQFHVTVNTANPPAIRAQIKAVSEA